jgi:hypothetical protein
MGLVTDMIGHLDLSPVWSTWRTSAVKQPAVAGELDTLGAGPVDKLGGPVPHGRLVTHRSLSLGALADRLDDQLRLLARLRPAAGGDDRHRSLRVAMDWSSDLLTGEQQALARRLSVFAGGFRLDAAGAVCAGGGDVLDGVDEMVAKSFVSFDATTARYRLLEPEESAPGANDGHGLTGMRERAILLGGSFDAARHNGAFRVSARLPYRGPSA